MAGTDLEKMRKVTLAPDMQQWEAFIASTLALVEASDRSAEACSGFVESVLDLFDEGSAIDLNQPAALNAGKLVIGLKPSQRLLDLVAAFRAGD